jgi:hypothetical protein
MIKKILDIRHFIILFLLIACLLLQDNKPKKEIVIKEIVIKDKYIHKMLYPQISGEPNFILIGVSAVFGLLVIIIVCLKRF